jgi:hypothetical protein
VFLRPAIRGSGQIRHGVLIFPSFVRRNSNVSSRSAVPHSQAFHARVATSHGSGASFFATVLLYMLTTGAFAQSPPSSPPAPPAPQAEGVAEPWRTDRFYFETSLYTRHFSNDPAHVDKQKLVLGEWNITEQWLVGASFFDNSFGQPTQYVYGGWRYRPFEQLQPFYVKVSAGLTHGYKDQYRDKIPFNHSGIAPIVIPSIGYCFSRVCSELVLFGGAGMLITLGVTIP